MATTVPTPIIAYIAVGANLGDRRANIESAIDTLGRAPGVAVTKRSMLMENPAVGGPSGSPEFLNGVIEVQTTLQASDLLNRLLEVERSLGRERHAKWDPRSIDLDLIFYGDQVIDTTMVQVPHPLMQNRRFVLKPLAEIAPDVLHPVVKLTVKEMLSNLDHSASREPIISRKVACVGCGYNLRGLPVEHICPECGRPTSDSVDPDRFIPYRGSNPYRDDPRIATVSGLAESVGYAAEALLLVADTMRSLAEQYPERDGRRIEADFGASHVVEKFEDFALSQFCGDCAAVSEALLRWGIRQSEDVGRVVFALVEAGWFVASESDRLEDFNGLFITTGLFGPPRPTYDEGRAD